MSFVQSSGPRMPEAPILHQGGSRKWSGSGCMKVDPTGVPGRLGVVCERKRGISAEQIRRMELPSTELGTAVGEASLGYRGEEPSFGRGKSERRSGHPWEIAGLEVERE